MGCHFLPQGIFHTQGWNPHIRDIRVLSYIHLHWQEGSLPVAPPVEASRSPEENRNLNIPRFGYDKSSRTKKFPRDWLVSLTVVCFLISTLRLTIFSKDTADAILPSLLCPVTWHQWSGRLGL